MRGYNTTDHKGNLISTSWWAGTNKGVRCPVPGCDHTGEGITKYHCRNVHGMEREEVRKKYGMPTIIEGKGAILSDNNGRKWYSVVNSNGLGAIV